MAGLPEDMFIAGLPKISVVDTNYLDNLPIEEPAAAPLKPKKKKMTKAERKAKKLFEAQEFRKLEFRDALRRELELSRKSAKRGFDQWETMCKDIKMTELRMEVLQWTQKTETMLHRKDEKIMALLEDMDATREMHERSFSRQIKIMDYMIDSYKTLMESTKVLYEYKAGEAIQDFYEEMNQRTDIENKMRGHCENIMHATNLITEDQMTEDYKNYMVKRDDHVNTEIERRYKLRDAIVEKMKLLRKQLLTFIHTIRNSSLDTMKFERITFLMDRQRNFVVESKRLNELEFRGVRIQGELQRDLLHKDVDSQRRINDLRLEQSYFQNVRKSIESNMRKDREITFEKMKVMTTECRAVKTKLNRIVKYGELILSLAANCRKYTTEAEKVDKCGEFPELKHINEQELLKTKVLDLKSHFDLSEEELDEQIMSMQHFWRRQAMVELHNVILQERKRNLIEENEKYREAIKALGKSHNSEDLQRMVAVTCLIPAAATQPCDHYHLRRNRLPQI